MNTEPVTDPGKIMNTLSKHWDGERMKAMFRAANYSKLRYPLLIMTLLLLAAVAITARQLAEGILAEMQGVVYLFPF
jgi:hypothetical protein